LSRGRVVAVGSELCRVAAASMQRRGASESAQPGVRTMERGEAERLPSRGEASESPSLEKPASELRPGRGAGGVRVGEDHARRSS
jgi:hypothetical protein